MHTVRRVLGLTGITAGAIVVSALAVAPAASAGSGRAAASARAATAPARQKVTITAKPNRTTTNRRFRTYGTVSHGTPGEKVTLEDRSGRSWKKVDTTKLRQQRLPNGRDTVGYVFYGKAADKGKYHFRVVSAGSHGCMGGTSRTVTVTVT